METKTNRRIRIAKQITEMERREDYGGRHSQLVIEYSEHTTAKIRSPRFWSQVKRDAKK